MLMQNPVLWHITEGVEKHVDGWCRAAKFPAAPRGWRSRLLVSQESEESQTTLACLPLERGLELSTECKDGIPGVVGLSDPCASLPTADILRFHDFKCLLGSSSIFKRGTGHLCLLSPSKPAFLQIQECLNQLSIWELGIRALSHTQTLGTSTSHGVNLFCFARRREHKV